MSHRHLDNFFAKRDRETGATLSLADHSADVAAVTVALLERTLLGRRLAHLAGLFELHPGHLARLGYLAALHDLGKLTHSFQRRIRCQPGRPGHVQPAVDLLAAWPDELTKQSYAALGVYDFEGWSDDPEFGLQLLYATFSHHGRPHELKNFDPGEWRAREGRDPMRALGELAELARSFFPAALSSTASGDDPPPIPAPPIPAVSAFQHGWNGILTLADWLGSSTDFFPFACDGERFEIARERARIALLAVGLDTTASRLALGDADPGFEKITTKGAPRPAQAALGGRRIGRAAGREVGHEFDRETQPGGSIAVLEASTGSGKTEAALWHFARLFQRGEVDGLYFALPTRTAATQIYRRLTEAVALLFADQAPAQRPPVVQAVPGYLNVDGVEGRKDAGPNDTERNDTERNDTERKDVRLPSFEVLWDDPSTAFKHRAWAAERSKRYLAGAVVAGTIDQVLLSALQVSHAHLRGSSLLRHLLVVDEVHASDAYMGALLERVLDFHLRAGGHALLMSATLGSDARERLLHGKAAPPPLEEALAVPYPALHYRPLEHAEAEVVDVGRGQDAVEKDVAIERLPEIDAPEAVAARALDAAAAGARVLIVRNTVGDCRAVQSALEEQATARRRPELLFGVHRPDGVFVPAPHHGRFAPEDRKLLDRAIEQAFSPHERPSHGLVAAATQTVEQSLDIDADLLITDLCPMDVLLQRLGRLHRHRQPRRPPGYETPRALVLVPAQRDQLKEQQREDGDTRGEHGLGGGVYPDLRILEATWRLLENAASIAVPRDNRRLVELATHPETLEALTEELGLRAHQYRRRGQILTARQEAKRCALPHSKTFGGYTFMSQDEEKLRTRLGDADVVVELPGTPVGPFGLPVQRLTLRAYEVAGEEAFDAKESFEAADISTTQDGKVQFSFHQGNYRYDRLGIYAMREKE